MSTVLNEGAHPGGFIVSEANVGGAGVGRGRETITLAATTVAIAAGTVLGKVTGGDYVPHDPAATDGSEVADGILFGNAPVSTETQQAVGCMRDMEVNADEIVWDAAITPAQLVTAGGELSAKGIVQRAASATSVSSADSHVEETITL